MEPTNAPAPAAAESVAAPAAETLTAVEHAATTGDMGAFRAASRAERAGKPLPAIEPAETKTVAEPAATVAAEPKLSRKEREQQETNERVRIATERATADLRAELAELRAATVAAPKTEPAATKGTPAYKRYAAMPDAPKLTDVDPKTGEALYDSMEEHSAAMALFVEETRYKERQEEARSGAVSAESKQRIDAQDAKFRERMAAAVTAEPDFRDKIPPVFHNPEVVPLCFLPPGKKGTFANVVAEVAFFSEQPATLLKYLHAHQDEVTAIANQPSDRWMATLYELNGRMAVPVASPKAAPVTKTLTDATTTETLGERTTEPANPSLAAAVKGDMKGFRAAERAKRAAQGLKT